MTSTWRIWSNVGYGAFEYLGEADGETFVEACRNLAETDPQFAADFDPRTLTVQGSLLVPLDRRIDGKRLSLGEVRDVVAEES